MFKRNKKETTSLKAAAAIQFVSKYSSIVVQLATTMILARLITPEEFGIVAIVTVFLALFNMLSDAGISIAIIQYRDLTEQDYGSLFGFTLVFAFFLALIYVVFSVPISIFYQQDILMPLCSLSAFSLVFNILNMVPNGLMLREKRFFEIGLRLIVATLVSGVVGVLLAFLGAGCYALIVQAIVQALVVLLWNLISRPIHQINFHFAKPVKRIFSYSAFQAAFNLVNYLARNLDNILIGKGLGMSELGYYDKAYKLTTYPLSAFSGVIASVVQPYMAEHQNTPDVIYESWMKITSFLSLAAALITTVLFSFSTEIIEVVYGSQWQDAIPVFQILSLSVYFQMVVNPTSAYFQSMGKTNTMFLSCVINAFITLMCLFIGLAMGSLMAISELICVAYCLQIIPTFWLLVVKTFKKKLSACRQFLPDVISIIVVAVLVYFISSLGLSPFVEAGLKFGSIVAVFFLAWFPSGRYKQVVQLLKRSR